MSVKPNLVSLNNKHITHLVWYCYHTFWMEKEYNFRLVLFTTSSQTIECLDEGFERFQEAMFPSKNVSYLGFGSCLQFGNIVLLTILLSVKFVFQRCATWPYLWAFVFAIKPRGACPLLSKSEKVDWSNPNLTKF